MMMKDTNEAGQNYRRIDTLRFTIHDKSPTVLHPTIATTQYEVFGRYQDEHHPIAFRDNALNGYGDCGVLL